MNGEEYKHSPMAERRRLKTKRDSGSVSETTTNNDETTPLPSTSKKTLVIENKVS